MVLVTLTAAGADYLRHRRRAGAGAFAGLIGKLPPGELDALPLAIPAMNHLRDLDGVQRGASVGEAPGGAAGLGSGATR